MDITHQGNKVFHRIDRLTTKAVLEEMAITLIFFVEIIRIRDAESFHDRTDVLFLFTYQKVYMIAHQTIGINDTKGLNCNAILIITFSKSLKTNYHLKIIFIILKDILTVDTSKHDMIDARTTFCSLLSRHELMIVR